MLLDFLLLLSQILAEGAGLGGRGFFVKQLGNIGFVSLPPLTQARRQRRAIRIRSERRARMGRAREGTGVLFRD